MVTVKHSKALVDLARLLGADVKRQLSKEAPANVAPADPAEPQRRTKQDPATRRVPPSSVDPGQLTAQLRQGGGPGHDLVPNQFSLGGSVGMAACGPAALVALESAKGKDMSLPAAVDAASQHGWNTSGGMNGFGNFVATAKAQGLDFKTGSLDDVRGQVDKGNPVVISTNQHYFVAQAFDPATGKYFFGNSGTALRAGSSWLTLDQVAALGHGINGVGWAE